MGSPKSTEEKPRTFNERAGLRWFLYVYRLCRPEVLGQLAEATSEPEHQVPGWAERMSYGPPWLRVGDEWFSQWTADFWLPDSRLMREIADATVTIGSAGLEEPRWGFEELPPEGPPDWEKVVRLREPGPHTGPSFTPTLPGRPLVRETDPAYTRWKRAAVEIVEEEARKTVPQSERMIREFQSWQPEEQWFLAPGNAERIHDNYSVYTVVRDLSWLAMKQATGAGYGSIPHKLAKLLDDLVPGDFLQEQNRRTVKDAIGRAAARVGLVGRLRSGKSGRPRTV